MSPAEKFAATKLQIFREEGAIAYKYEVAIHLKIIKRGEALPPDFECPEKYIKAMFLVDKLWR